MCMGGGGVVRRLGLFYVTKRKNKDQYFKNYQEKNLNSTERITFL